MTDESVDCIFTLAGGLAYAGGSRYNMTKPQLRKFVELLLETEREACAKVIEASPSYDWHKFACEAATAIRERGKK